MLNGALFQDVLAPVGRHTIADLARDSGLAQAVGHLFLRGKIADGNTVMLRAQVSAGRYINLQGKAS
jgi:hypothetical protein